MVSSLLQQGANPNAVGTGGLFDNKTPLQVSRDMCRELFTEEGVRTRGYVGTLFEANSGTPTAKQKASAWLKRLKRGLCNLLLGGPLLPYARCRPLRRCPKLSGRPSHCSPPFNRLSGQQHRYLAGSCRADPRKHIYLVLVTTAEVAKAKSLPVVRNVWGVMPGIVWSRVAKGPGQRRASGRATERE